LQGSTWIVIVAGVFGIQVGLEVIGQVVGPDNGNIPGHHEMEFDKDLRP